MAFILGEFSILFIHLAALGLFSCGMWALVPQPGIEPGLPLH